MHSDIEQLHMRPLFTEVNNSHHSKHDLTNSGLAGSCHKLCGILMHFRGKFIVGLN